MSFYSADPIRFGSVSAVTTARGSKDPEVGARTTVGDEEYIYVYNQSADAQINPGHGAICTGVTGYTVNVTSVSAAFLIGVCKHATITTGAYGWLCTRGFTSVEMGADYSAAAGNLLTLSTDGTFDIVSNATGSALKSVGQAMEAVASGASGQAFISTF